MLEVIPITEIGGQEFVSARDLHTRLKVKTKDVTIWFNRRVTTPTAKVRGHLRIALATRQTVAPV